MSDQVCLEPGAAFFLADARLMTGQQVLHGIAAATAKTLCMENVPEIVNMITPDGELVIDRLTQATAFDWMTGLKLPGLGWNRG